MRSVLKGICATAIVAAAVLLPVSGASAATWLPCTDAVLPIECATYDMPLDRTGALPGITKVRAIKMDATEGPRMGTMFVIAGGPGQTSQVMLSLMSELFAGANRYDVIAVDQRGSGASEPLDCPRIESGQYEWDGGNPDKDSALTACSVSLGAARSTYNTAEAVGDLDAVRQDLGVGKVTLFGVSYGTKVALAYAKAHPDNTKALLIDSVLPTDQPSAFDTDSIAAARSALDQICASNRCRSIGTDPVSRVAKLSSLLARDPIHTYVVSPTGGLASADIDDEALYSIIGQADFNLFIYSQLPGALTRALSGDPTQLVRLYTIALGDFGSSATRRGARKLARKAPGAPAPVQRKAGTRIVGRDAQSLAAFSNTMYFATTCADFNGPYPRSETVTGRQPAIDAGANALSDAVLRPFTRRAVEDQSTSAYCRGWQQNPTPPAIVQGPLPNIPTLALDGELDQRTPIAWAQEAIAGDPSAQLVKIPYTGHSVIGTDISGCALSLAKRFLIFGTTDGKCQKNPSILPVAPLPPQSLKSVRALPGNCSSKLRGKACLQARRELTAGYLAIRDTFDQALVGGMDAGPGLLGGEWVVDYDLSDDLTSVIPVDIAMDSISNVPGVYVSGTLNIDSSTRFNADALHIGKYRVSFGGSVAYNRAGDSVTLRGRSRGSSVTVRVRPRSRAAARLAKASGKALAARRNWALATGTPPAGQVLP